MSAYMRVGGLASGIDTESIIKDYMRGHRLRVDRLAQDKQILEWQQEDLREINTLLRSFRDTASDMRFSYIYKSKSASSTDASVVTAMASSKAANGKYEVEVRRLAEGVTKGSQVELADESDANGYTRTLAAQFGLTGSFSFELEGANGAKVFNLDADTDTIYQVEAMINNADLGIKASYDKEQNRFFLSTETIGSNQKITVLSDADNFLSDAAGDGSGNALGLQLRTGDTYTGQDALLNFGDVTGMTSSSNSIRVKGIAMELKAPGTSTISVANATGAVFDAIIGFIDQYNTTVKAISDKYYEERFADYPPLTDEQREQLTDTQIEQWEEKARSGLLRRDSTLSEIMSDMRSTMAGVVPGLSDAYDALSEIGITTTNDYWDQQLVINEDELREAIEKDPEGIMNLFTSSLENYEEMGIAKELYQDIYKGMTNIMDKAGMETDYSLVDDSFIGKEMADIDDRLERWEYRLQQIEDRYYRQFTAMEKAIQQLNAQSAWLMQQFGQHNQ